jgi:hypothetical protein
MLALTVPLLDYCPFFHAHGDVVLALTIPLLDYCPFLHAHGDVVLALTAVTLPVGVWIPIRQRRPVRVVLKFTSQS